MLSSRAVTNIQPIFLLVMIMCMVTMVTVMTTVPMVIIGPMASMVPKCLVSSSDELV